MGTTTAPKKKIFTAGRCFRVAKVGLMLAIIPPLISLITFPTLIYFFPAIMQHVFFLNFRRIPLTDYDNVTANDVTAIGRSFYLQGDQGTLGVWHTIPASLSNQYRENGENPTHDELEKLLASSGKPIVLYAHGNSFDRTINHRCMLYNVLNDMDYHVIAFDYRGYGDSEGSPTEEGIVNDTRRVYDYVKRVSGNNLVIVWGHSMGTGVSTRLVRDLSVEGIPPDGLVLEAAFNNLHDVIVYHPFSAPFRMVPDSWINTLVVEPFRSVGLTMETDERIKEVTCPIIIMHAEDDHVIPASLAKRLTDDAKSAGRDVEYVEFAAHHEFAHKFIYLAEELPSIVRKFFSHCEEKKKV